MKKIIILLLLFIGFFCNSQTIKIGQKARDVYSFYNTFGFDADFYTFKSVSGGTYQELILRSVDFIVYYSIDEKTNIIYGQKFKFFNKKGYYRICDALKVSDVYKEYLVKSDNILYRIRTYQAPSDKGLSDYIWIIRKK